MVRVKVIIIGATGYSGIELIRILSKHPNFAISYLFANSEEIDNLSKLYPHLINFLSLPVRKINEVKEDEWFKLKEEVDLIFLATPAGISSELGYKLWRIGFRIIDLAGDYRIRKTSDYEKWYKLPANLNELREKAVYGLAEVFPEEIKTATYIANPGCYATSVLLGLAPIFKNKLKIKQLLIDAKSGVSGAGRKLSLFTNYSEINENLKPYKVGTHQHIPEIEQTLEKLSNQEVKVTFIPHLVPMTRGILSSIYLDIADEISLDDLQKLYQVMYHGQPFVRLLKEGEYPATKQVYGSNYTDIALYQDRRTNKVIIFSAIDNLIKGAAGQAVQNANLMFGFPQETGLDYIPLYP